MSCRLIAIIGLWLSSLAAACAGDSPLELLDQQVRLPKFHAAFTPYACDDGLTFNAERPLINRKLQQQALSELNGSKDDFQLLYTLGCIQYDNHRIANRDGYLRMQLALAKQSCKDDPTDPEYWLMQADSYADLRRFPQAIRCFEEAKRLNARNPKLWQLWGSMLWSQACLELTGVIEMGEIQNVYSFVQKLSSSGIPEAKRKKILALVEQAGDYLDWAVLLDPDNVAARRSRVSYNIHRLMFDAAFHDRSPDTHPINHVIIDDFTKIAELEPNHPRLWATAIRMEYYQQAFDRTSSLPRWETMELKSQHSIRAKMQKIQVIANGFDMERSFEAHFMLGYIYYSMLDQPRCASVHFRKAFEMKPDHPLVGTFLCSSLMLEGRWDGVLLVARRATELVDSVANRSFLAEALYQTRRDAEAQLALAPLYDREPEDGEHLYSIIAQVRRGHKSTNHKKVNAWLQTMFAHVEALEPEQRDCGILLACIFEAREGHTEAAIEILHKTMGFNRESEWAYLLLQIINQLESPVMDKQP